MRRPAAYAAGRLVRSTDAAFAPASGVVRVKVRSLIAYIIRRLLQLVLVLFGVTLITFVMLMLVPGDPGRRAGRQGRHTREASPSSATSAASTGRSTCSTSSTSSASRTATSASRLSPARPVTRHDQGGARRSPSSSPSPRCSSSCSASPWASTRRCASTRSGTRRSPRRRSSSGASRCSCSALHAWLFGLKLDLAAASAAPGDNVLGIIPADWRASQTLILPAVTLGLIEVAYISYMQRASMLEVIRSDYIRTARAKGLTERKVICGHGFKNAVIPVMTIAGIDLGALMGGAIITETVFTRPGIGLHDLPGHRRRATCPWSPAACSSPRSSTCSPTCFVDLGYAWVDPRIRLRTERVPTTSDDTTGNEDRRGPHGVGTGSPRPTSVDARRTAEVVDEVAERRPSRSACGPTPGAASSATSSPSSAWASSSCSCARRTVFAGMARARQRRPANGRATSRPTTPTRSTTRCRPQGLGSPPSLVAPVRHRLPRPRRALADPGRDAHLACSSASSPSPSRSRIGLHPGAGLGLLRRRGRLRHHAHRRHLLRLPVHPRSCCSS